MIRPVRESPLALDLDDGPGESAGADGEERWYRGSLEDSTFVLIAGRKFLF
jgi:hypothetical protein